MTIAAEDRKRVSTVEFVGLCLICLVLGLAAIAKHQIVRRLGVLSALTAAIFAGFVVWIRP
jgi:hypothetical protein